MTPVPGTPRYRKTGSDDPGPLGGVSSMRQWELIGITDQVPAPTARRRVGSSAATPSAVRRWLSGLLLDHGHGAAYAHRDGRGSRGDRPAVRRSARGAICWRCSGWRGRNLAILEAHVAALERRYRRVHALRELAAPCAARWRHPRCPGPRDRHVLSGARGVGRGPARRPGVRHGRRDLPHHLRRQRPALPAERRNGLDDPCDLVGAVRRARGSRARSPRAAGTRRASSRWWKNRA